MTRKRTIAAEVATATTKITAKVETRAGLLAQLDQLNWQGPRSYTASDLRDLLIPWVAAGCPQDGVAPAGALAFVYPPERKTAPARRSKGYLAAMTEVREMLAKGITMKALTAHLDDILTEAGAE